VRDPRRVQAFFKLFNCGFFPPGGAGLGHLLS
jgi:hypothetical protein